MNKPISMVLVGLSALALSACGNNSKTNTDNQASKSSSSSKMVKKQPLITAENNKITYPKFGTIEFVGFKKDTIKSDSTTDVDRGENVYLVEMKVTNTSKKELDVDDIADNARISFLQNNNGSLKNVEASTGIESVASPDDTDSYNNYTDATNNYDDKILPGKSATLLYPSVIHLANDKSPLIIQAGGHDKDDTSVNFKKDRLTYSLKELDKMTFSNDFISKFGNTDVTNSSSASSSSNQSSSNTSKKVATNNSEPKSLSEFINKYGMSPVAYKMQHDGMSQEQALKSTPDTMKSSGELQSQYLMEHPVSNEDADSDQQLDPNGEPIDTDNNGDGFDDKRESDNAQALSDYVKTHHQTDFK